MKNGDDFLIIEIEIPNLDFSSLIIEDPYIYDDCYVFMIMGKKIGDS